MLPLKARKTLRNEGKWNKFLFATAEVFATRALRALAHGLIIGDRDIHPFKVSPTNKFYSPS
jgi:hypothetical protein